MTFPNLEAQKKILIVIPDWGLAWNVYCLEYAVELSRLGADVSILDLSSFNPIIFKKITWRFFLKLAQKNQLIAIKKRVSKSNNIRFIEIKSPKNGNPHTDTKKARDTIFLNSMASKYAGLTGRRNTQLSEIDPKIVELEQKFFFATINLVLQLQSEHRFGKIITVNGRYVVDGAVVQACKEAQIDCSLIESASATAGKYTIYDVSPHDIPSVQGMHLELWNKAGSRKNEIAERGLQLKLSGKESPGSDFRSSFTEDFISKLSSSSRKIAVFFPSSDREFAIFPEFIYQESFGGSQAQAFLAFSQIAKRYGYHVIVRVHPVNSKSSKVLQDKFAQIEDTIWQELCSISGSEIIESRSKVSSYGLIERAQLCATYASSISIECILSGKPTLILGESEISYCVPEICAFSETELASKFKEGIPIIKKSALYPYGYWLQSAGMELKLFNFISDHEVYFGNKLVNEYRSCAKTMLYIRDSIRA